MSINILDEMKTDFLVYAQEVNQNRAFPDAKDGLKPSQRAALYTMYRKGFTSDKPHVKSAKITGAIIGELWPHGDSSAYESIVRMSQPWINNLPEVEWHGANGSLLGGPEAASSRYTECRLSKLSEDGFFSNIKKNTVDFIPNFSEDDEWPSVCPAIFPRLIVNGSQGIGYTIAQDWAPTNLKEFVAQVDNYLNNGEVDCNAIYPDYPTGGTIINKDAIHTIYETGKGSIILRAKAEIEDNMIKITELPYQVYAEPLIQKIKDLVNNEQIAGIEDICNKSDDYGLLIEIECNDNPEVILNKLYKLTDLQVTFSSNMMALVDGVPIMLTLEDYIKVYVEHNVECIKREYQFDLDKANARWEIVEGLLLALDNIDEIISIIKASKSSTEAVDNIVKKCQFSNTQAKAIVDMKLGRLANLEITALKDEQKELDKTIKACAKTLSARENQLSVVSKRLHDFTEKYGWERRTQLTNVDIVKEKAVVKEHKASTEQYMVALTAGNTIKRIKLTDYRPQTKIKNEDDRIVSVVKVGAKDKVILISAFGKMYKLQANKIALGSMTSSGTPLNDTLNDVIIAMFDGTEPKEYIFMLTDKGKVKKINAQLVFGIGKNAGTSIMKLNEESIIDCRLVDDTDTIIVNDGKKDHRIEVEDFKAKGKSAGGVTGVKVKGVLTIV